MENVGSHVNVMLKLIHLPKTKSVINCLWHILIPTRFVTEVPSSGSHYNKCILTNMPKCSLLLIRRLQYIKMINCRINILNIKIRNNKPPLLPAPNFFILGWCEQTSVIFHMFWKARVEYDCIYNALHYIPLTIYIIHPYILLSTHIILSIHLRLGLSNGLFPSGFPTRTLYTPFSSPIRATCPAHLILLDFYFTLASHKGVCVENCKDSFGHSLTYSLHLAYNSRICCFI